MRIYNYTSQESSDNPILKFVGKDVWVEAIDNEWYYYYFRFLSYDDTYITCNIINADIIDELDSIALLEEFPTYPVVPMDLNKFFTDEFIYRLSDIELYTPSDDPKDISILTSEEILAYLRECARQLMEEYQ